ncbi:MAG: YidC/Oxa1 family membrane protein insertase [Chloroflexota bacterium]
MWDTLILNPMINTLLFIYNLLGPQLGLAGAFGLAIIGFTLLIRLITLPLTFKQQQSTQRMQEMQQDKRFLKLQEKHKGNRQKLQEEQMKLYKELGINPLSGCLPTVIQLPIIFGLYGAIIRALANAPVQLLDLSRHIYDSIPSNIIPLDSRFLWMDLGQPERLQLDFLSSVPILGQGLPVLAIIVVVTTYLQTKLTTPPSPGGQGAQMTQVMNVYMPLFLGYFAYTLASGLALYFVVSNLLGIIQAAVMKRMRANAATQPKRSPEKALPKG